MRSFPPDRAEMEAIHSARPITEETLPGPAPIQVRQDDVAFAVGRGQTSSGEPTITVQSTRRPDLNLTLVNDLDRAMAELQDRHARHTTSVREHQAIVDRTLTQIRVLSQIQVLADRHQLDGD